MFYFLEIENIKIKCIYRKNAKKLILHYGTTSPSVTVPYRYPKKLVETFVSSHLDKLQAQKDTRPPLSEQDILSLEKYLEAKIVEFSQIMNLPTYPFKVKKAKSYWGKCFVQKKYMIFNVALANMPEKVIDYVIVHELAHFKYPNHSKDFYSFVETYFPNFRVQRKFLKKQRI